MPKTYPYKDLIYTALDDEEIIFSVSFISDGNSGDTYVDLPGDDDRIIKRDESANLGRAGKLKEYPIVVISTIRNSNPNVSNIKVAYFINGEEIQYHENEKSETDYPTILLKIEIK